MDRDQGLPHRPRGAGALILTSPGGMQTHPSMGAAIACRTAHRRGTVAGQYDRMVHAANEPLRRSRGSRTALSQGLSLKDLSVAAAGSACAYACRVMPPKGNSFGAPTWGLATQEAMLRHPAPPAYHAASQRFRNDPGVSGQCSIRVRPVPQQTVLWQRDSAGQPLSGGVCGTQRGFRRGSLLRQSARL